MKVIISIGMVALLFFAGYAVYKYATRITEGEITAKWYEGASTTTMLIPMRVGETTILTPYIVHDDEDFMVTIQDGDETADWELYKEYWEKVQVGDWISVNEQSPPNGDTRTRE